MMVSFFRSPRVNGFALVLSMAVLSACSTDDGERDPLGALIGREMAKPRKKPAPGPDAAAFVGEPIEALETFLGAPGLTRQEGENEFRRYDLRQCRAYAIVVPAGGDVTSLTTGPVVQGDEAPSFRACTAGLVNRAETSDR
ncbi:MAG: hypothetical protein AAF511_06280 [Pseudomonadota bacterium]